MQAHTTGTTQTNLATAYSLLCSLPSHIEYTLACWKPGHSYIKLLYEHRQNLSIKYPFTFCNHAQFEKLKWSWPDSKCNVLHLLQHTPHIHPPTHSYLYTHTHNSHCSLRIHNSHTIERQCWKLSKDAGSTPKRAFLGYQLTNRS